MSSINQNIKSGPYNVLNKVNPHNLFEFIKPSRILFGNVNPDEDEGTLFDYYINTVTGDFFEKDRSGAWILEYNFATGGGGSDITNIENDGAGIGWFRNIIGSTAHFKSVNGAANEIDIIDLTSEVQLAMNANYKPATLSEVGNFPLQIGVGGETFNPNGTIGEIQGYNRGSIFVQIGANNKIWLCDDPVGQVWSILAEIDDVKEIANIGTGSEVFKQTTAAGVAELRKLENVTDETTVVTSGDSIQIGMSPNYKPATLALVQNIKNAQGEVSPPGVGDDSAAGYSVGSLWTTPTQVWLCENSSVGAAVWNLVEGGGSDTPKDFVNWTLGGGSYVQNMSYNYSNFFLAPPGPSLPIVRATQTPTAWTATKNLDTIVFQRGAVPSAQNYEFSFTLRVEDFAGATTTESIYDVEFVRLSSLTSYSQSICTFVLPASGDNNRVGYTSATWLVNEASLAPQGYYFNIRGRKSPSTVAPNLSVDHWSFYVKEL